MKARVVISCEHGGNEVPLWLKNKMDIPKSILESHKGIDENQPERDLKKGDCIHLSVHSSTSIMNGIKRNSEFSLLYDPSNESERNFAFPIKKSLNKKGIKCRLNYPSLGRSNGITTYFRKKDLGNYIEMELEFNQAILDQDKKIKEVLNVRIEAAKDYRF